MLYSWRTQAYTQVYRWLYLLYLTLGTQMIFQFRVYQFQSLLAREELQRISLELESIFLHMKIKSN